MATARPFAYNTGSSIPGTEQVGNLAVGTPSEGFSSTGLPWWNGPDEELGYVIAKSVPGNNQPVPVGTGATGASVGFLRSSALTESSFIEISNYVAGPFGGGPFESGSSAKTWLNTNGYWTSYDGGGGGTGAFVSTVTQIGSDVVWSGSGSFNLTDLTAGPSGSITAGYNAGQAIWAAGPITDTPTDQYEGSSFTVYPSTFQGGSGSFGPPVSGTGDVFGILSGSPFRTLIVPLGYVSESPLSGSTTYANTTISGMGLSGGTYIWSWGSGANVSSLTLIIN